MTSLSVQQSGLTPFIVNINMLRRVKESLQPYISFQKMLTRFMETLMSLSLSKV